MTIDHQPFPVAWTIAGTDPSGGAGIQADLKTMNAFGVHACSVITAVIAQNTLGVRSIEYPSPAMVRAQLDVLREDLPPAAIKLGMLGHVHTLQSVTMALQASDAFVVCDPVLRSSSGTPLLEADAFDLFRHELLPRVDLLTPNIPEAETLLGHTIASTEEARDAAQELLDLGPRSVLLKGGHREGEFAQDYWTNGTKGWWLTLPRLQVSHTHGAGCVYSSGIAACRAAGYQEEDAIVLARVYVQQGLRTGGGIGHGRGPLGFGGWPACPDDFPWITPTAVAGEKRYTFPDVGDVPLGLYPIVDRADWLQRLRPLGITTIQLRVKDLEGAALETEVKRAIEYARAGGMRLFINDQWELAIRHAAYGVHLGQDDLATADLGAIAAAHLRLGISTHSYAEMARALAYRPTYIALGTLFETTSKVMDYPALGLESFARMRRLSPVPVVAIGGINLERAPAVLAAGADGLAVISEVAKALDLEARMRAWAELLAQSPPPRRPS